MESITVNLLLQSQWLLLGIPQISGEFIFQQDEAPASSVLQGSVAKRLRCGGILLRISC